jgi:GLPGLI family protein
MKNYWVMKRFCLILISAFLGTVVAFPQDFQGIATYQSKTTIEINLEGRNIPEAQRQQIMENMKRAMERTYTLTFDRTSSIYEEEERLETPGAGGPGGFRMAFTGGFGAGVYYKNVQEQSYRNQTDLMGKPFLIKDSLDLWQWKLGSETKKIGNYTCYKATAIQKADTAQFNRMRRRFAGPESQRVANKDSTAKDSVQGNNLLSRINAPKDRVVTAWFTPEIPVSQGPGPYWGLPGLILEVSDERTVILCSKLVLNPEDKLSLEAPSKGKEVTQKEYSAIMEEKMGEMSERFRGRGGRGEGIQIRISN